MGPVPGVSWADAIGVVAAFAIAAYLLAIQGWLADAIALGGRPGVAARAVTVALIVPFLIVLLDKDWLAPPDLAQAAALLLWLGGTAIVNRASAALGLYATPRSPQARPSGNSTWSGLTSSEPAPERPAPDADAPSSMPAWAGDGIAEQAGAGRRRFARGLGVLIVAAAIVTPRAVSAVTQRTPCEEVEVVLAARTLDDAEAQPEAWMPRSDLPGYRLTDADPTTLETVVAGRRNPEESRTELARDSFVRGYQERWEGPEDHVEFEAQRFASSNGALDFQAFANRYACQFANEAFVGPHGAIGLQIRFAAGRPIGEQISWVSNTTRIIVFVDFDAPPADHSRVESLVGVIDR